MVDDDSIHITNRIVDEDRLKEAEIRPKELKYAHEREIRKETLLCEQKKVYRISLIVFICALLITYSIPGLRTVFGLVLIFGVITMYCFRGIGAHYFYVKTVGMGILRSR